MINYGCKRCIKITFFHPNLKIRPISISMDYLSQDAAQVCGEE